MYKILIKMSKKGANPLRKSESGGSGESGKGASVPVIKNVKCPTCDYQTDPFFMKIHQCPNRKDASKEYCCYECIRRKKKRFRTIDGDEYKKHFKQYHTGKTWYPNKADLQRYG